MTERERLNKITETIIGAAIQVHRILGPGFHRSNEGMTYKDIQRKAATILGVRAGSVKVCAGSLRPSVSSGSLAVWPLTRGRVKVHPVLAETQGSD